MERVVLNRFREELKSLSQKEREEFAAEIFGSLAVATRPFRNTGSIEELQEHDFPEETDSNKITTVEIKNLLLTLGIPTHVKGYQFLTDAIKMCIEDPDASSAWTKIVYPDVAKMNKTTPARVERAIRHSIELACSRWGNIKMMRELFEHELSMDGGKVMNSRFISGVVEHLKSKHSM